jgi:hypothetical protein
MTPGPRLDSRYRWYTLPLAFVQEHIPHLLCLSGCTHHPCLPPVVTILVTDPRGRGRPPMNLDDARVRIAVAIHAVQRRGDRITQARVREQAAWPSSASKLSVWTRRLGYPNWKALVADLKLTENP